MAGCRLVGSPIGCGPRSGRCSPSAACKQARSDHPEQQGSQAQLMGKASPGIVVHRFRKPRKGDRTKGGSSLPMLSSEAIVVKFAFVHVAMTR